MEKYINEYVNYIDKLLNKNEIKNKEEIIKQHLVKIQFFQHERLIHLIVTISFAFMMLISLLFTFYYKTVSIVTLILLIMLIFYIKHYYVLENKVQHLYVQYDELLKR